MSAASKPTSSHKPLDWRAFWLPREGHSAEEYEDAFAGDVASGRFALSDGASESAFARLWARLLVEHFVGEPSVEVRDWHNRLPEVQQRWQEELAPRQLPWHAEQKFLAGSFATFLGVEIRSDGSSLRWQAVAVGDSCLFHTRGDQLLCAWPLEKSAQFDDSPRLVGSRTPKDEVNYNRALWKLPQSDRDDQLQLSPGDRLWLMTDALAQWFLMEYESGGCPWQQIDKALSVQCEELPSHGHHCLAACGNCGPTTETDADEPAATETNMPESSPTESNMAESSATETDMSEPAATGSNVSEPTATEINTPATAAKKDNIPEPAATQSKGAESAATGGSAAEVAKDIQRNRPDDASYLDSGTAEPAADQQRFQRWIDQLRRSGRLRNDDVTLVVVRIV